MADLNERQLQAVHHVEGPMLVLAGAGSGKTRVVTYRIAHLLDMGVLPSDILAVTFTNKAAQEMQTRVRLLKNARVLTCTFHSLGARILRESISHLGYSPQFTIYDEEDSEKVLKTCLEQLGRREEKGLLKEVRQSISKDKNALKGPLDAELHRNIYELYQKKMQECQALDFDDLLYLTVKLLQEKEEVRKEYQNRWLFLLIDEYQDTNLAQYTLAKTLSATHRNLFVVGDPDQSIYSWRGARYQNILNFESDFPGAKIITLEENYRSTNTILSASNALIQQNTHRYEKKLWSALGEGSKIGVFVGHSEKQEAEFVAKTILQYSLGERIPLNDMAIFYRTNAQSRIFEDVLLSRKIPYVVIGGLSFYQRKEIKDLLAFLKMVVSNADEISFLRTVNLPKRGLGNTTVEKITQLAAQKRVPIFSCCEEVLRSTDIKLSPKQRQGLQEYVRLIHHLREKREGIPLHELLTETVTTSGYLTYLQEDPESAQERKENVQELIGKAAEWEQEQEVPSLPRFLEELSLNQHTEGNVQLPSVQLMTFHNSKGLEFTAVFLVGLVEDLCPHINSKSDPEALEEERRLCYVGMTRAKQFLFMTASLYRFTWAGEQVGKPSRFFKEIPNQYLKNFSPFLSTLASSEESPGFTMGAKVFHQEFGEGVVRKAFEGSFGLTYEVFFPGKGTTRTLAAKYAKLQGVE